VNGAGPPRRILLVAYFYPPSRDTGVLRPVAMAKWLRRLGHEVTVLTTSAYGELADDATEGIVRTTDAQRLRARLAGQESIGAMFDAPTYSGKPHPLSRVLVPEALVAAWMPFARSRALRLRRDRDFDCVITTSPPESAHAIGVALHRRGLPWVADVRDAWTFESLRPHYPTGAQRRLDAWLERRWLGRADAVVCVSRPAAEDLRRRGIAEPLLVPNGWDPESAPSGEGSTGLLDPDRRSIVYTGRFGTYGRDPGPLVAALTHLGRSDREAAAKLELVVAGPLTGEERRLFETDVGPARIVLVGSLGRERALTLQREADVLLLLAQPTRSQLLNIKLFEYLASGSPILALAAGTEAGRVAGELGAEVLAADDATAIVTALARVAAGAIPPPPENAVAPYTYPAPAQGLAAAVEAAINRRRGR